MLISEPASTGSVRRDIHQTKTISRVATVGLSIAEDDGLTKNTIVFFEDLSGFPNGWTKAFDVFNKVRQAVKLDLDKNIGGIDIVEGIKHVADQDGKIALKDQLQLSGRREET